MAHAGDESLLLKIRPKPGWNRCLNQPRILGGFSARARADHDADDGGVTEGKLQRRRREGDGVRRADGFDPASLGRFWRGGLVEIRCPVGCARRKDAGVEGRGHEHPYAPPRGDREKDIERVVIEQRVLPRDHMQSKSPSLAKRAQTSASLTPTPIAFTTPSSRSFTSSG